jgi:adhesin transport system membrane fusion protein
LTILILISNKQKGKAIGNHRTTPMRGEVSYISPDVLVEETKQGTLSHFRVRVKVTGKEFKGAKADAIRLRAGLTATVEIKAQDRTVLSYLTKPITKTLSQSMGER